MGFIGPQNVLAGAIAPVPQCVPKTVTDECREQDLEAAIKTKTKTNEVEKQKTSQSAFVSANVIL